LEKETAMSRRMTFVSVLVTISIVLATTWIRPAQMAAGLPAVKSAKVDPLLTTFLSAQAAGATTEVVITYNQQPGAVELGRLQSAGIMKGFVCQQLPMVIADMNLAQLALVRGQSGVKSIWANRMMKTFTNASRPFIGVNAMSAEISGDAKDRRALRGAAYDAAVAPLQPEKQQHEVQGF
jgi:hypothetical protein